jgi:2-polyprenyl-6-methoxyphenol hydroxylase-like FAD-dependent oxidoreductase
LSKALFERFGVKIEHRTELVSFKSADDKVTAQLLSTKLDGTTVTETAEAKYLVGTDGGRSRVRKELGLAFEGEKLPGVIILGDIHMIGMDPLVSINHPNTRRKLMLVYRFLTLGMSMLWDGMFRVPLLPNPHSHISALRTVFIPASTRPGHPFALRMLLPAELDDGFDPDVFVKDPDAVRRRIGDIMERSDIKAGEFTYLATYKLVQHQPKRIITDGSVFLGHTRGW